MNDGPNPAGSPGPSAPVWLPRALRETFELPNDRPRKIVAVAFTLCLVCSLLVSSAAVLLRPIQESNQALDRKRNILAVTGLLQPGADVERLFERVEVRAVDLESGRFTDAVNVSTYDQRRAAADPARSVALPRERDVAGIGRRAQVAIVYLLRDATGIQMAILPVRGYGLWSTLDGFVALSGDLRTVAGLRFYEHAETPGLGGEVDNPAWQAKWRGKAIFDDSGRVRFRVVKGVVDPSHPDSRYAVDGLSGATLTSRGVENMIRFWLGEDGFGPFLANLRSGKA